ncbi:hypothetical protein M407DRAFT_67766 [Tulasnella calospora MUT 4182]|uniref:Lytic polysaccharide monooxygenase n=1 Tax=Tulasnella calospora MUT 4182 TaxID=1051891 RepID=A0A0C3QI01_9AGAM|nr:hypothetical protein M407DRAFT_67766 [Tulasnella calospora MUT 4182]
MVFAGALAALSLLPLGALAHLRIAHPSMYGFNVSYHTFDYDNRPEVPLQYMSFQQWWFHNHIQYPPHDGDVFEFPAGGSATIEIGCNKGWTSYFASDDGRTDLRDGSGKACGGSAPDSAVHAASFSDVTGCGIGIVDKANVNDIKPEDFAIFSANHTCPWFTCNVFHVPADMPACSEGVCHCAWFWIHSPNSGGEQMFMNAFKCKITNTKPTAKKIGKPQLARRCGHDPVLNRNGDPKNCTVGPQQPLYWLQNERNNMFEGYYDPPFYNGLYGYKNGAQDNIFVDAQGNSEGSSGSTTTTTKPAAQATTTTKAATTTTAKSTTTTAKNGNVQSGSNTSPNTLTTTTKAKHW